MRKFPKGLRNQYKYSMTHEMWTGYEVIKVERKKFTFWEKIKMLWGDL